jgi:anti-anti-sigma factor
LPRIRAAKNWQKEEEAAVKIHTDNINRLAVVECEGEIVGKGAATILREAVVSREDSPIIVLDMTEVNAVEGAGLVMLLFLRQWAIAKNIRFKLFNPSRRTLERLQRAGLLSKFEVTTLQEVIALTTVYESVLAMAS